MPFVVTGMRGAVATLLLLDMDVRRPRCCWCCWLLLGWEACCCCDELGCCCCSCSPSSLLLLLLLSLPGWLVLFDA